MTNTLVDIAEQLKNTDKKVQLIYAFNGIGKTRLSREFKKKIVSTEAAEGEETQLSRSRILYYNAFTEDLFYWDNDNESKLKIQSNTFTDWILRDRGQDQNIIRNFQRYSSEKLTPVFIETEQQITQNSRRVNVKTFPEVTFSYSGGANIDNCIKISKGEESNFVWSVFYTLLQEVVSILDEQDPSKRDDDQFDNLEYVFIDDPVSSLDDNHLIELAVDLAYLIKRSAYRDGNGLKFIITTHSPLFYNVLHNELNNDLENTNPAPGEARWIYKRGQSQKYRLDKLTDGEYMLSNSNDHPFSYHLFLLSEVKKAIGSQQIYKYHFSFLRNILEKTATFLGHAHWEELLEKTPAGTPNPFVNRILNLSSHSAHAGEEITDVEDRDKQNLTELVTYLISTYGFKN